METFLDATKIESGILDLNFKMWDYCDLIKNSMSQNIFFANKKSQKLIFECHEENLSVLCDKNKMEQVLNNLLSNAIKYSPINKNIWVKTEIRGKTLFTSVIDEGQGIPERELRTIFDSYQTASIKSTAGEKSTG
jgi:K+-sensing histidine kinase KdpD